MSWEDNDMRGVLICAALWATAMPAYATKICVVDFQTAVTDTQEGMSAQKKIDTMYSSRKEELERMQGDLEKAIADFQSRAMILSPEARTDEQSKLELRSRNFEQTYMQYQNEMQQMYYSLLGDLDEKMRTTATEVGRSNACTVVLDKTVVVFHADDVTDISAPLVARYNQQHPAQ